MKLDYKKELTPVFYLNMPVKTIDYSFGENTVCFRDHWHERMEFLAVTEGSMTVTIDGRTEIAKKGDTVVICPGESHKGYTEKNQSVSYHVLMFEVSLFVNETSAAKRLVSKIANGSCRFENFVTDERIFETIEKIIKYNKESHDASALYIESEVYKILAMLFERHTCETELSEAQKRFTMVFDYISDNLDRDLSTAKLCKIFGYDESYFCRRFKSDSGLSVSNYVRLLRLEKSQHLLSMGVSVNDTAISCGFSTPNYFSRCFKEEFGISPREYVKKEK